MKKLITIILILALFLPASAWAERSFDEMSYEELHSLNADIQLKLFEKGSLVDGVKVPSGIYTVGKDIPSGTYRIEYRQVGEFDYVSFMALNEKEWLGFTTILGFSGTSEVGKLELPDETEITVSGGDVYFYTYTGLFH